MKPPKPTTLPLPELPVELILEVTDFLDTCSVAALSLTCRLLLAKLGNRSWFRLRDDRDECAAYLSMHLRARSRLWFGTGSIHHGALDCYNEAFALAGTALTHSKAFDYTLGWVHVLLAHLNYPTNGPHDVSLDIWSHRIYRTLTSSWDRHCYRANLHIEGQTCDVELVVTPRIADGYLLLKCQCTFTHDGDVEFWHLPGLPLGVCTHVLMNHHEGPNNDPGLVKALRPVHDYRGLAELKPDVGYTDANGSSDEEEEPGIDDILGPGPERIHIPLRQCSFCATEYEAHKCKNADKPDSVILTAWTNLGAVKSPDSQDFHEHNRLWDAFVSNHTHHHCEFFHYPKESIKNAFENWDPSTLMWQSRNGGYHKSPSCPITDHELFNWYRYHGAP